MKLFLLLLLSIQVSFASTLKDEYFRIKREATRLALQPNDISARVEELRYIYHDSRGRHTFALVAAHGAKWGRDFLSNTAELVNLSSFFLSFNPLLMDVYLSELDAFSKKFQLANREVFIDTYTNYYFSKIYGRHFGAEKLIDANLLKQLNKLHSNEHLSKESIKGIYIASLLHEQDSSVTIAIEKALNEFRFKWMLPLVMSPKVRFNYFPEDTVLKFKNFSRAEDRIHHAIKAYDIAVKQGWYWVEFTL